MATIPVGFSIGVEDEASQAVVWFEADPGDTWIDASAADQVLGRLNDQLGPIIEAARLTSRRLKELSPDELSVSFGIKVGGESHWIIAKGTAEANLQVTLTWKHESSR